MEKQRGIEGHKHKEEWLKKIQKYCRGEIHSHSKWSNRGVEGGGKEDTIHSEDRLLQYADKLGLDFVVFSEHASNPGSPVELSESHPICQSLLEEKQRIEKINLSGRHSAKAFSAAETSIFFNEDGEAVVDLPENILSKLDIIIASRHAIADQLEPAKIEASILAVIDNPEIDIIGHPYRNIEFYEHDWNYFKKYWKKDPNISQELQALEDGENWDKIKQIIGKEQLGDDARIKELSEMFSSLKGEYWQSWENILKAMEEKGKAFEINLNIFNPSKEFYRSLLKKASKYQDLNFSITFDFHNLKQLSELNDKDGVAEKPEGVTNSGRAKGVQRLLDLVSLLEELGVDKNRIINSSKERLEKFIDDRGRQRNSHYISS